MGKPVYEIAVMHPNESLAKHNLPLCMANYIYENPCLMTGLTVLFSFAYHHHHPIKVGHRLSVARPICFFHVVLHVQLLHFRLES